ncbi:MAG TPA: hypothetical protein QF468_12905 [Nitrospinota bacterium]|nr:hypothetical protein [Nitrospinota bacterium]
MIKKYWKIIVPVAIGIASMSVHFLPIKDTGSDAGLIFDMREILGKTLTDDEIPEYAQLFGPFVNKSKAGHFPDISGDLRAYNFKYGRIETIGGMIFGTWYLFKSSFAHFNGFEPTKLPVPMKEIALKSFGFPPDNKNFNSNDRAYIWEDQFNIRQLQLYREPSGENTIVSVQAYLVIPWEGLGSFHKRRPKNPDQGLKSNEQKNIIM